MVPHMHPDIIKTLTIPISPFRNNTRFAPFAFTPNLFSAPSA